MTGHNNQILTAQERKCTMSIEMYMGPIHEKENKMNYTKTKKKTSSVKSLLGKSRKDGDTGQTRCWVGLDEQARTHSSDGGHSTPTRR